MSTRQVVPDSASATAVRGFELRGGDWLDAALGLALLAAGGLVWIHRRRRYIPRPPVADLRLDSPDLTPLPAAITEIRRAVAGLELNPAPDAPRVLEAAEWPEDDDDLDAYFDDERAAGSPPLPAAVVEPAAPIDWPPAGLGLTGDGAESAARGFLVGALAETANWPDYRPRVVIPSQALATLLGTDAVLLGDTARLHITAGLAEALTLLEEHTLERTRLVYDHEADDITALRAQDIDVDPLPRLLLIADTAASHERRRVASVLAQGGRLDIYGVMLGDWPEGDTLVVAADGTTGGGAAGHVDVDRLTVLGAAQAADLLRTVIEADTGAAQPRPDGRTSRTRATAVPSGTAVQSAAITDTGRGDHASEETLALDSLDAGTDLLLTGRSTDHEDQPDHRRDHGAELTSAAGDPSAVALVAGRARVRALGGPLWILDLPPDSKAKPRLLRKAREVLAYLVAHPRGVAHADLMERVFGDARQRGAKDLLNSYVYNASLNLRAVGGPGVFIDRTGPRGFERCQLRAARVDVDLWRMQHHIDRAAQAEDDATRIVELRAAAAEYAGHFLHDAADEHDAAYEWVEPIREAIRRQALDAHVALADLLTDSDPMEALAVLSAAIGLDVYNEDLYQRAMRLHAAAGDDDAIRRLRRDLTLCLTELEIEPSDDTLELANRLLYEIRRDRPRGAR